MNYFGEAARTERSAGGSSSSRKGKKSNSDKPKQPQRGLGVAQLEKIRLHSQLGFHQTNPHLQEDIRIQTPYSSSSSFSYTSSSTSYNTLQGQPNFMMGTGELERSNILYGQSQPSISINPRWNANNAMFEAQYHAQPGITRHLFELQVEDSLMKKNRSDSMGSSSQNSDSNGSQELDLELRLSL